MRITLKRKNKYDWHDWFAWRPVIMRDRAANTPNTIIWLEKIERRKECDREFVWWTYRLKNIKVFNPIDGFRNGLFVEGEILAQISGTPIPEGFEPYGNSGDIQYIIYKGDKQ